MLQRVTQWLRRLKEQPASSKDDILQASKPRVKEVYIPQFNATVFLRQLSVRDARKIRQETPKGSEEKSLDELTDELEMYYARLMAYCVLDGNYQPIYTVEQVFDFDVEVFNQLFYAITDLNRLNVDLERVKEELKKSQEASRTTS